MKFSSLLLAAVMVIVFSGCKTVTSSLSSNYNSSPKNDSSRSNSMTSSNNISIYSAALSNGCSEILKKASNDNLQSLIKAKSPFEKLCSSYLNFSYNINMSRPQPNLVDVNNDFPIECIRKMNDNHAYAVYQTDEGYLFYLFFFSVGGEWDLACSALSEKDLGSADFSAINQGTDEKTVEQIDPATKKYFDLAIQYNMTNFTSKHLLRDGMLILNFSKNSSGNYCVSSKQHFSDFKQESGFDIVLPYYDYSILPQDHIK